jgi:NAD+ kinase
MTFSIIANPDKYAIQKPLRSVVQWAEKHETPVFLSRKLSDFLDGMNTSVIEYCEEEEQAIDESDIIIAIGGDGTMLYTARLAKNTQKPLLGINSGRLGFMAKTSNDEINQALHNIRDGNYRLDRRHMLQAVDPDGKTYHALNEFLFSKKDSTSMITVKAEYQDMLINRYWADGLIIASPTGSTAYNLSSLGPIVMPETNVMVVTPVNPHTLTTRPLVLDSDHTLKVTVEEQPHNVFFSYDGNMEDISHYPFEVEIKRSNFCVDLVELPGHNYFETLRDKLMWGMDFREYRE